MNQTPNVGLDAVLLHAALHTGVEPAAIALGLTPDEVDVRAKWFKGQPKAYQDKVIAKVIEMEKK